MLYFLTIYIIFVMLELAAKNGAKQWRLENINVFFLLAGAARACAVQVQLLAPV
jgi:hypothetical protein